MTKYRHLSDIIDYKENNMNWRKEAENELKEYKKMQNIVTKNSELIRQLDEDATTISSNRITGDLIKSGSNLREDWLVNNISKKSELEMKSLIAKKRMELVDRGMLSLTKAECKILELFYIIRPKGYIDKLCDELGYEQSNLYYHKDIALRKFTLAVYGVIDT